MVTHDQNSHPVWFDPEDLPHLHAARDASIRYVTDKNTPPQILELIQGSYGLLGLQIEAVEAGQGSAPEEATLEPENADQTLFHDQPTAEPQMNMTPAERSNLQLDQLLEKQDELRQQLKSDPDNEALIEELSLMHDEVRRLQHQLDGETKSPLPRKPK